MQNLTTTTVFPIFNYVPVYQTECIAKYFALCATIATVLLVLPYLLGPSIVAVDKNTAYECGFEPFIEDANEQTENHFIIVAILFVVFDLEVVMLVPFAPSILANGEDGLFLLFDFVVLLIVGLYYE